MSKNQNYKKDERIYLKKDERLAEYIKIKDQYFYQLNESGLSKEEKINYKIREHSLAKTPMLFICGDKEVKEKSVTIRILGSNKQEKVKMNKAINKIKLLNKLPI